LEPLFSIVDKLDRLFKVNDLVVDPSFGYLLPLVYEESDLDWHRTFEPDFAERFNGLMLRGDDEVRAVYCSVLPAPEVLESFLRQAQPGDLFFTHHPIDFEMGDPRGEPGRGPLPIETRLIEQMKTRRLSFYSCHAPMDYNREIGTTLAMEQALGVTFQEPFYPYVDSHVGSICSIPPVSTAGLIEQLKHIFDVSYVDHVGVARESIERIAIVAGASDKVEVIQDAESHGAQALLSGEVRSSRVDAYGRAKHDKVMAYLPNTKMSIMGVSHAASEQLVMETHMAPWFSSNCRVQARTIRLEKWWR
jgi:putative NIF3 family GTP cyclohydrolase 1 type 2